MTRVIGVDPGTESWDFCGLDSETGFFLDQSLPTAKISEKPKVVFEILDTAGEIDLVVAPSGFGLPLKRLEDLTDEDLFLTSLKRRITSSKPGELIRVLNILKEKGIPGYIIPGVKHLPSIPKYKKVNKIDLGTADKLCTAVLCIKNQMDDYKIACEETGFIMVELGYAFSSVLAVEKGKIIDGIGGSNVMGFRAIGALDGELAYLMGRIRKKDIYSGGVSYVAGYPNKDAEEILLMAKENKRVRMALNAFYDSVVKSVFAVSSSFEEVKSIREIIFAGRLVKQEELIRPLFNKLRKLAKPKVARSYVRIAKEAAQGAAFIADGILGGPHRDIIDNLEIKNAKGSILDYIYVPINRNFVE